MKILVGTLYTIENEFDDCCASINAQTYNNFEHLLIKGKPNKEAHDILYQTFEKRSDEFDLMIKVDADMVIENTRFFEEVVSMFKKDAELNWLILKVHDFYSNNLIWGLNVFRNNVKWNHVDENLFPDHTTDSNTIKKRIKDAHHLEPAAFHCKNPSDYQAFHFGFHRGIKIAQPGRTKATRELMQWNIFKDVYNNLKRTGDIRLALANAGYEFAVTSSFNDSTVSYTNPLLSSIYKESFENKSLEELLKYISRKRLLRFSILPYPFDFAVIYFMQRIKALFKN